jgi:hypothetical protein
VTVFLLGSEKQTARCERSLVSLPAGEKRWVLAKIPRNLVRHHRESDLRARLEYKKLTSGAFHRHDARSDVDLDIFGDLELLLGVDVQHLDEKPPGWWWIGPDLRFVFVDITDPLRNSWSKGKCALTA